jgi:hypothetical protein
MGEVEPERYSNRDLKFKEICFLTKFGICNWKFTGCIC